jgi:hypothetical protein
MSTRAKKYKKANKSEWWMPRLEEATKDVISCEKSGVGANNLRSPNIRMRQLNAVKLHYPLIGRQTRGTETSNYPQEKKTKVIPLVVASERGTAQTNVVAMQYWGCRTTISII